MVSLNHLIYIYWIWRLRQYKTINNYDKDRVFIKIKKYWTKFKQLSAFFFLCFSSKDDLAFKCSLLYNKSSDVNEWYRYQDFSTVTVLKCIITGQIHTVYLYSKDFQIKCIFFKLSDIWTTKFKQQNVITCRLSSYYHL